MPMTNQPLPHRADRHPAPGLDRLVRAGRTEQRLALRAGIVLAAADGQPNVRIAASAANLRFHSIQMILAAPGLS
jgi:hypothetical protein